jgi:hypothetical protein
MASLLKPTILLIAHRRDPATSTALPSPCWSLALVTADAPTPGGCSTKAGTTGLPSNFTATK